MTDDVDRSAPEHTPERTPEHVAVFEHLRAVFGGPGAIGPGRDARRRSKAAEETTTTPFGSGRDPRSLDAVLDRMTADLGWDSPLARSVLVADWAGIVGEDTAQHSDPIGIEEGVLTVRCDSTAWATQLRRMASRVTRRILEEHPAAGVDSVRFLGPDAPSWKRGLRAVPGRGPRDTYG